MKKFLSKKSTFISFLVSAIVVSLLLLYLCVRPVSYGLYYSKSMRSGSDYTKMQLKPWGETATIKITMSDAENKSTSKVCNWVYIDGNKLIILETKKVEKVVANGEDVTEGYLEPEDLMSKEEYKQKVAELKQLKKTDKASYNAQIDGKFNAFSMQVDGIEYICHGAIAFVTIFAVCDVALIALAVVSGIFSKQKKVIET